MDFHVVGATGPLSRRDDVVPLPWFHLSNFDPPSTANFFRFRVRKQEVSVGQGTERGEYVIRVVDLWDFHRYVHGLIEATKLLGCFFRDWFKPHDF